MIWKKMGREELIQDVVYQRVEMILEQHCMEKNGRKDLEREILARIVPGEEVKAEELLEQGISQVAMEHQILYRAAFLDGLWLGIRVSLQGEIGEGCGR